MDLFICSENVFVLDCTVDDKLNIPTDHCLVDVSVGLEEVSDTAETTITGRCLSQINEHDFNTDLEKAEFWHIFSLNSINDKLSYFNSTLLKLFDKHAPVKTFHVSKKKHILG